MDRNSIFEDDSPSGDDGNVKDHQPEVDWMSLSSLCFASTAAGVLVFLTAGRVFL